MILTHLRPQSLRALSTGLGLLLGLASAAPSDAPASTLFALVDTGELFVSTAGGDQWSLRSTLPVSDGAGLLAASESSELVLASRRGTVYESSDAGVEWSAVGTVPAVDLVDLAGLVDGTLLALTRSGSLWASDDGGASFTVRGVLTASNLVSMARGGTGVLLALTASGTVSRSTDGGATWVTAGAVTVSDAVAIRFSAQGCYVLTDAGLTFRSVDDGATWTSIGTLSQVGMRGLAEDGGDLVALHRSGLTARSVDGGSWTWVGAVNQLEVVALANDVPQTAGVPGSPGVVPELMMTPPSPNPLRAGETVRFGVGNVSGESVALRLLDAGGRCIAMRSEDRFPAGRSSVTWDLPRLTSGVYFLEVAAIGQLPVSARIVIVD